MCLLCDWLRWLLIDLFSWLGSRCLLVGVRCCVVFAWCGLGNADWIVPGSLCFEVWVLLHDVFLRCIVCVAC